MSWLKKGFAKAGGSGFVPGTLKGTGAGAGQTGVKNRSSLFGKLRDKMGKGQGSVKAGGKTPFSDIAGEAAKGKENFKKKWGEGAYAMKDGSVRRKKADGSTEFLQESTFGRKKPQGMQKLKDRGRGFMKKAMGRKKDKEGGGEASMKDPQMKAMMDKAVKEATDQATEKVSGALKEGAASGQLPALGGAPDAGAGGPPMPPAPPAGGPPMPPAPPAGGPPAGAAPPRRDGTRLGGCDPRRSRRPPRRPRPRRLRVPARGCSRRCWR